MPYIYKITNDINNKIYIGKTIDSIQERWRHHVNDSKTPVHSEKMKHRPLYAAMQKYGIEHFHIEQIEECSLEDLNDREQYWIEILGSFKTGYNATKGGDGRQYLDYELIIRTYEACNKSISKTASLMGIDRDSVKRALISTKSYTDEEIKQNGSNSLGRCVGQYDKNTNELIATYPSIMEAERHVKTGRHIGQVCMGKRKTAGGYIWRYIQ